MIVIATLNLIACAAIVIHGVCVLNDMTKHTSLVLRVGYSLMVCGAAGQILAPLYGVALTMPGIPLLNIGLCLAMIESWRGKHAHV